jgi:DNA replication initiation complex subunit (GINS family)
MANPVTTKLKQLSNQYSVKVKRIRELEAALKKPFVSDADAKKMNQELNKLNGEIESDFEKLAEAQKLEKTAKDYTSLQTKIKEKQIAIAKAEARGESTTQLKSDEKDLIDDFNSIAPDVEKTFPDIKVKPAKETKTGPLGNVQMTTGTTIADTTASKESAAKGDTVTATGEKPKGKKKPGAQPEEVVPAGFNVGTFRQADEASMAKTKTGTITATGNEDINAIYELARSQYGNVDSIFLYDPELKALLIEAIGDPTTAVGDMKPAEFARRLAASDWAIRNGTTYAKRDAQRREYDETLAKYNQQLELADTQQKKDAILSKIGQLKTTSSYAMGLASAKAFIEATASGLTGTMSPERLDAFVKRMYDSANDKDVNIINRELAALISYKPGTQLGGAIGGDLTTLRATARANGFDLDTSFGSSINDWLQRLAKGESIETFKNTIRGAAKLGLPDKVANLLDQGLDLKDIYDPYKKVMASVLEVAPDSISLDDKTLRMAIGPEKEMSLYDFQRTLRKDPRWQYTNNAREESSDAVLGVLRNFGFQG